ncbi:MAG: DUF2516 family protein [Actinomycetes bacterium]
MDLFGPISALTLIITIALLCLILFALVDALIRPSAAYVAAGKQTKLLWGLVLAVGFGVAFVSRGLNFFALLGVVAAIVYIVDVRPAVKSVGRGGSSQGPYGPW